MFNYQAAGMLQQGSRRASYGMDPAECPRTSRTLVDPNAPPEGTTVSYADINLEGMGGGLYSNAEVGAVGWWKGCAD